MRRSLRYLRLVTSLCLYGLCLIELFFSDATMRLDGDLIYLIVGALLLRTVLRSYSDSLSFMIAIITIFLFALPSAAIYALQGVDVLPVLFTYIIFSDLLIILNLAVRRMPDGGAPVTTNGSGGADVVVLVLLLAWCALAGVFIKGDGFLGLLLFMVPFGVSLVYLDLIVARSKSRWQALVCVLAYLVIVYAYLIFQWDGFGRIVIGALILAPLLVVNARLDLGIRPVYVLIVAPFILYVAQVSRYDIIDDAAELFIGSAGHHLTVSHDVLQRNDYLYSGGLKVFLEQYLLFFLQWVPRDFWSGKPIGIGLWSVDVIYGRAGFSEGYSHSIGFLGEQYFYLGGLYWLGLIAMLVTLVVTRSIVNQLSFGYVAPVVLFDVNLASYFWGGGATFGSRFWFLAIPALLACWLLRRHVAQPRLGATRF